MANRAGRSAPSPQNPTSASISARATLFWGEHRGGAQALPRRAAPGALPRLQKCDQSVLQLAGDLDVTQGLRRIDGAAVGVDERDARRAAFDVPLEQLAGLAGEGTFQIVAEELGDLLAVDGGGLLRHGS